MNIPRDIFIDTSAFIAMRVSDDVNHKKAQRFLKTIKEKKLRLHTTNFVLDEVYTYFCKVHEVAVEMAELIMDNPLIALHRVSVDDEDRAWEILKDFKDKKFSYTDAVSFAAMQRLGLKTVFAFDEHFSQYGKFILVP
ncbi:MAG: PIN domain-containing protein [Deferribacteres bacterium]|nr:PIN domain-containing protein [Deferribacteres bacterium]